MLVECGFVRVETEDGDVYSFTPSFARIAALGSPQEVVKTYAALHSSDAQRHAAYVLASLCDQEECADLIGWPVPGEGEKAPLRWHDGAMPQAEQIILARHLMQHGIVGKARPERGDGKYSDAFNAAEYVAAAVAHLGMSEADAEALSMTGFQLRFEMKFPDAAKEKEKDIPSRAEYDAAMARFDARGQRGH